MSKIQEFHPSLVSVASGALEYGAGSHLIAPVLADELGGHVCREYILQEEPRQVLHCLRLLSLLPQFPFPQEVQAAVILILPSQDKEREEEDEEVDSSHQFGFLQYPWPERSQSGLLLALSIPDGLSPVPSAHRALSTPSPFSLWVVQVSGVRTVCYVLS